MTTATYKSIIKVIVTLLVTLGCILLSTSCAIKTSADLAADGLRDKWGIEITQIQLTANGYMVDFRYRVIDAEKSKDLFSREKKAYLIDQASGLVVDVPNFGKIGPLRTTNPPKQGRIYWMFFNNLSGIIKPGSKVTVVIGDFKVENMVVT